MPSIRKSRLGSGIVRTCVVDGRRYEGGPKGRKGRRDEGTEGTKGDDVACVLSPSYPRSSLRPLLSALFSPRLRVSASPRVRVSASPRVRVSAGSLAPTSLTFTRFPRNGPAIVAGGRLNRTVTLHYQTLR